MFTITMMLSWIIGFTIVDSVDIGGYANGVAFGNNYVWACDNSSDYIFKIDPDNMQIVSSFYYSGGLNGLAHDGEYLWIGYWPDSIHKIDTLGNFIDSWLSPGADYSYGMAFDGQYLWHADRDLRMIYKVDHNDPGYVIESFNVSWIPRDLGWYRDNLWVIADANYVYELDPTNMNIINSWFTGRPYSSGIALGGEYLWFGTNYNTGWVYKVEGVIGIEEVTTHIAESGFKILRVYPNPSRGSVTFTLSVPEIKEVMVRIFNPSGRLVRNLFNGIPNSSMFSILWDGKDNSGNYANSGIYFVRVETRNNVVLKKIIFLGK